MQNDRYQSAGRREQGVYGDSSRERQPTEGQDTGERRGFDLYEPGESRDRQFYGDPFERQGGEYRDRGYRHGSRSLGPGEGLRSRSMDPGQSSYGGFRGEDPYYQRQDFGGDDRSWGGSSRREQRWGRQQSGDSQERYGSGVDGAFVDAPSQRSGGRGHAGSSFGRRDSWEARPGEPQLTRRIDPKGYTRSDERIREIVCEQLSYSGLDVSEVSVSVKDGQVMLEGTVPERRMKHAIEDCVHDCSGVKEVENRVRVASRTATESD